MLVSQNHELLDISIPDMVKRCNWCLIMMDNESQEVEDKVCEYQKKYNRKIFVRRSSMPSRFLIKGKEVDYRRRWKAEKGVIRDEIFINLRKILDYKMKSYDKIDILVFYDSDEIFTDHLPELLEKFWKSDYKAISMKPIDVVNDMRTIKREGMGHHVHIMKYNRELAGLPWRFWAMYFPLRWGDLMRADYYSVHLAYFSTKSREWRNNNWKFHDAENCKLYPLPKNVYEMTPEEINNILKCEDI